MGLEVSGAGPSAALGDENAKATPASRDPVRRHLGMSLSASSVWRQKLAEEYQELREEIGRYQRILSDEQHILDIISAIVRAEEEAR